VLEVRRSDVNEEWSYELWIDDKQVFMSYDPSVLVVHYRDAVKTHGSEPVAIILNGPGPTRVTIDYSNLRNLVRGG